MQGLVDALGKQVKVSCVSLNFYDWQIDEHTCDLGSILLTGKSGDKLENRATNDLLVAGVDFSNSGINWHGLGIQFLGHGIL